MPGAGAAGPSGGNRSLVESGRSRILVVEDEVLFARAIMRHLKQDGFEVLIASSGSEMRRLQRELTADLVLLDLNLGGEDGMDLARELAATPRSALIIVTGRDQLQDRIDGLDAGADDYITKPFDVDELRARVRAVLRRRALERDADGPIRLDPMRLDLQTLTLQDQESGRTAKLTERESKILAQLMRNHGRILTRADLLGRTLVSPDDRSVDVHIGNIRRKLRSSGIERLVIWPVRGLGYRLRVEPCDRETETRPLP
jgi:DNA-binding response OmpR family regulator